MRYLLDANVLMESMRLYYARDLVPSFWEWLERAHQEGDVGSVKAIRKEILDGKERGKKSGKTVPRGSDLITWAESIPASFWLEPDAQSVKFAAEMAEWAVDGSRPYNDAAVEEFMDSGDLPLMAQALAIGATVVTREQPAPESKRSIKIPDVCGAFNIPCETPFAVYRALSMKLS